MGFSANPYRQFWLVFNPDTNEYKWECSSCGGESEPEDKYCTVEDLRKEYIEHLVISHKLPRNPEPRNQERW